MAGGSGRQSSCLASTTGYLGSGSVDPVLFGSAGDPVPPTLPFLTSISRANSVEEEYQHSLEANKDTEYVLASDGNTAW